MGTAWKTESPLPQESSRPTSSTCDVSQTGTCLTPLRSQSLFTEPKAPCGSPPPPHPQLLQHATSSWLLGELVTVNLPL